MGLKEEITGKMKEAMKAGDKPTLSTLRYLLSAVKNKEIEKRRELADEEVLQVVSTLAKQRQDSIEQFRKGGRDDLVEKEVRELAILKAFMPQQFSAEEIQAVVDETAAEVGAEGMKDMGRLMKAVMAKLRGRADGRTVQEIVKKKLGG